MGWWVARLTCVALVAFARAAEPPSCYDVVFQAPTAANATKNGMPLGNGRLGAHVWIDGGGVHAYFQLPDMFTGQMWLLKAGRVDVALDDAPFAAAKQFAWWLSPATGSIHVAAQLADGSGLDLLVFPSINDDTIYVSGQRTGSSTGSIVRASAGLWRVDRTIYQNSSEASTARGLCPDQPLLSYADTVVSPRQGHAASQPVVAWYQRNNASIYASTLAQQGLGGFLETQAARDLLLNLTFGGLIAGDSQFDAQPTSTEIATSRPVTAFTVAVRALTLQCDDAQEWIDTITALPPAVEVALRSPAGLQAELNATAAWWAQRWNRSSLIIAPQGAHADPCDYGALLSASRRGEDDGGWEPAADDTAANIRQMRAAAGIAKPAHVSDRAGNASSNNFSTPYYLTQNWILGRFMDLAVGYGSQPIRFNGDLYSWDADEPGFGFSPDFRNWGGGLWQQNTRLMYWPALAAGDYDLVDAWYRYFLAALPLSAYKVATKFGHAGAVLAETTYPWGAWEPMDYGCATPPNATFIQNQYIQRHWTGNFEALLVALLAYSHTGNASLVTDVVVPLANATLTFYMEHWPIASADGKAHMVFGKAAETWWNCTDPTTDHGALLRTMPLLTALPTALVPSDVQALITRVAAVLPSSLPVAANGTGTILLPCANADYASYGHINSENTELYPMWPYQLVGRNRTNGLEAAGVTAFTYRQWPGNHAWLYDAPAAAVLGLADQAMQMLIERVETGTSDASAFPAYYDAALSEWAPTPEHNGIMRATVEAMLLQEDAGDGRILAFPAWPASWDVQFTLHASQQTIVSGRFTNGTTAVTVLPQSRAQALVVFPPQATP